jgi:hypothetical protein
MGGQVWLTTATPKAAITSPFAWTRENGKTFNEKVFHTDNPEPLGNVPP